MKASFTELVEMVQAGDKAFKKIPRDDLLASTKQYVDEQREAIRKRHTDGASGGNIIAMLTQLADDLIVGVFRFALSQIAKPDALVRRIALCAQGGYGRAQLNPYSDLDVGLIFKGKLDKNIETVNKFVVPFLWDVGFENSFVVRSVKEAVALAKEDTRVFTSYLECRLLYGSSELYAQLRMSIDGLHPGDTEESFTELKLRERSDSLAPPHRDLYAPEPNIKDGAGGLRDYHTGLWLLTAAYRTSTLDEMVSQDFISPEERLQLAEALDLMWRIRNELHFASGRREDRLTLANQQHLAIAFGYTDPDEPDTLRFLEDYYAAARRLRSFLKMAARIVQYSESSVPPETPQSEASGILFENGEIHAGTLDPHWFEENPARLVAVFWECARRNATLSHQTERSVKDNLHLVGETLRASDLVRRFFVAICNRPHQAGPALRQAAQTGLLGKLIPEFAAVEDIIRYEDFHRYPVDEHTLRAIEALGAIPPDGPVSNFLERALEHMTDPYILVLALLFHDLGKASGENHSEEGMRLTRIICSRMGLPEEDTERIAFLVRHHLLMTTIAIYRDTDDLEIVDAFAKTMKTEERLRALFLLSYADMSAVAPNVWNDWKGTLLLKLYLRTEQILLGRSETVREEFWRHPKADKIRELLTDGLEEHVERHLRVFEHRYFVAFTPEQIAGHIECLDEADKSGFAMRCIANEETATSDVVVCTRDHAGLFGEIAGSFAAQLIDVERAALFTRPDGMALDCFTVVNASQRRPLTKNQFKAVEKTVASVLFEDKSVDELLKKSRRRIFALMQSPAPVHTRVSFDNKSSTEFTVIDIESADRTGLLYDITRAMTDNGLNIDSARIVTDARRARDAFYITLDNKKIVDEELQAEFRKALQAAMRQRPTAETKGGTI